MSIQTKHIVTTMLTVELFALLTLRAYALSPSLSVFSTYFPSWFFCSAGAVLLITIAHFLFIKPYLIQHDESRGMLFFAYLCSTIALALTGWSLFFQN